MQKNETKLTNKFVIDGELSSFEPKSGQYGEWAIVRWTHDEQSFSAMATGDAVEKLRKIVSASAANKTAPSISLTGYLQMKEGKNGGTFLNLRISDVKAKP